MFRKRKAQEAKFDAELRFHVDRVTEEKIRRGMAPEAARRGALVEFGGREQVKEDLRDVHSIAFLETMGRNLRGGWRQLRKSPSFSAAVILTLTLGIGANTTVFSAIDAVLLRPLPYPQADQLITITQSNRKTNDPNVRIAPQRLEDLNRMNGSLHAVTGWYTQDVSELSGVLPEKLTEAVVTPRFLQVWGIAPALGRDFNESETHFGGPNAVLISDRVWRRHFQANPAAIGRQLRLDRASYTVIGVLPASFLFPVKDADLWVCGPPDAPFARDRNSTWYEAVGRMKPGITLRQAQADLTQVQMRLARQYSKTDASLSISVEALKEVTVKGIRRSLLLLFGSVTLLLLIACTNVSALLLARMTDRVREISLRFSLGATRRAVVLQLLTECFTLALPGAAVGLLVAIVGTRFLRATAGSLPRAIEIALDWRIAAYTFGCSIAVTVLCGLLPALRGTRRALASDLAGGGRTQVSARNQWQWSLVGLQVSMAAVLLVGSGLLLRSFQELGRVQPGFEIDHILTLRITGNYGETTDWKKLTARIERTLDTLRAIPGVKNAATSLFYPGTPGGPPIEFHLVKRSDEGKKITGATRVVSDGYFSTVSIPLLSGQVCERRADAGAVVNRSFADIYLGGSTRAVGQHVLLNAAWAGEMSIRGVVADAHEEGINQPSAPTLYWCASVTSPSPIFLIRTQGEPLAMAQTLRRKIKELEPSRSVFDLSPLDEHLTERMAENRFRTVLLTSFAFTAVGLVCVGLYGTLSYFVNIRRREVGLRLAIGAARSDIAAQFLSQGLFVCLVGCAAGLLVAAFAARALSGMLFEVSTLDWRTFASVSFLILAAGALSSLVPALRASRVEPMAVLRDE